MLGPRASLMLIGEVVGIPGLFLRYSAPWVANYPQQVPAPRTLVVCHMDMSGSQMQVGTFFGTGDEKIREAHSSLATKWSQDGAATLTSADAWAVFARGTTPGEITNQQLAGFRWCQAEPRDTALAMGCGRQTAVL